MAATAESVPAPELKEDAEASARCDSAAERQSGADTDAGDGANGDASAQNDEGKDAPLTKQQAVMLYALRSQQTCGDNQVLLMSDDHQAHRACMRGGVCAHVPAAPFGAVCVR